MTNKQTSNGHDHAGLDHNPARGMSSAQVLTIPAAAMSSAQAQASGVGGKTEAHRGPGAQRYQTDPRQSFSSHFKRNQSLACQPTRGPLWIHLHAQAWLLAQPG